MKKILIVLAALFAFFLLGCQESTTVSPASVQLISAQTGKSMMDEDAAIILVDVRTLAEFNEGHIEGALLLPLADLESQAASSIPDKQATYIIYCRSGNRSYQAATILVNLGYRHIYDMGGIISWPYGIVIP